MIISISSALRRWSAWLVLSLLSAGLVGCNPSTPPATPGDTAALRVAPANADDTLQTSRAAIYACPMHPHIQQHGPGTCPICGMTLVQRVDAPAADTGPSVTVSADVIQSLGIRTATPVRRDVQPRFRVPARVVADPRGQARLQARAEGWIERLRVRAVGETVAAGSVVAEIYSPELVSAQEELLLGADFAEPARQRLRRFGIADADIAAIHRSGNASRRLPLRAPVSGVVTELGVREGSRVTPETLIVDIAGRDAVWIEAQLFPMQHRLLGRTLIAQFTLPGAPEAQWRSDAGTVVPVADALTQTLAVRFPIADAEGLPLGTVLDAEIEGETVKAVLLVPATAVIRTAQGDRVMVENPQRRFTPTAVKLGRHFGDDIEVVKGLAVTDRIVTSGQFLLDAEASLQSGLAQMASEPSTDATP